MSQRGAGIGASVVCLALVAACTGAPPPQPQPGPPPPGEHSVGLPQITPTPQQLVRLGDDIQVHGKVEIVVDSLVDEPTRDLAVQVLRDAGASQVIVREPGERADDVTLRVRIGDSRAPSIVKELQGLPFDTSWPLEAEGYIIAGKHGADTLILGASDPTGAYYAVQTLRQLASPGRIAGVGIVDFPTMPTRGTIEGFYGSPWTHEERMDQLAFYGDVKLNTYIYAPKDDPYHREQWREPYPEDKLAEVSELISQALAHHVRFTFALSPGTSICYSDQDDRNALMDKLQTMYDQGVRDFSVPLDDIDYTEWNCAADAAAYGPPSQAAAGRAQAELLNAVQSEFIASHPGTRPLQTVLTEYSDVEDSPYKTEMRENLDPAVQVMWTGDGVIPEEITRAQAAQAAQVWGREVMLWDNYPVNDFDGAAGRLMLGPYAKREPGLHEELIGAVSNPMNQAAASKVVEFGLADFAWNSAAFNPQRAWRQAASYLAEDPAAVDPLMVFFDLLHGAPLASGDLWLRPAPELASQLDQFRARWDNGDRDQALTDLRAYAVRIADAPARITEGAADNFVADAQPWLDATELWGQALVTTVDGLRARLDRQQARANELFATAADLADEASAVQTIPGENRNDAQALVADGVLDVFIRQARGIR